MKDKNKFEIITLEDYAALSATPKSIYPTLTNIIKVRYVDKDFPTIQVTENGNWIDLKCAADYTLKKGDFALIDLGVAMKLPDGYEALLAPRSSTFKKYGILQTNSIGVIDNSYSGNNDIWMLPVCATRDIEIKKGDRLCQFRILPTMHNMIHPNELYKYGTIVILEVENLDDVDRGGFGTSGR